MTASAYYSSNCGPPSLGQITPRYTFQQRTTLTVGGANLSLLWRYLSPVNYEGTAADYVTRGFTAANHLLFNGVDHQLRYRHPLDGGRFKTVNFNHIPAYHYFDGSAQFNIGPKYQLTMTVANIVRSRSAS